MENIIINFQADPSGLQPGIDGLVQLEVVDKEVADQAKKTAAEMQKRDKAIADGAAKSVSQVEKLSTSFKGLDKSIVGGTYNKQLKELQKNIEATGDEFKGLGIALEFAKKKQQEFDPSSPEWQELQEQIEMAEVALAEFGDTSDQTGTKTVSMKTKLRQIKEELSQMEAAGQEGTQAFQTLAIEAAKLEDQISDTSERIRVMASDTANIDAVVEGIGLISTGFQFAAGAQALFGEENEDMQKALVKLNAIMAITNSIQQVQNVLRGQSILRLKAESIGQAILATSTRLTSGAYNALGVSVTASSTAFKVLRTVLLTTGIGAIVVAVGFLIEKLSSLSDSTDDAAEKQDKLNQEYDEFISKVKELDELDRINANRAKNGLDNVRRELEVLKESGATKAQIFAKEQQFRNEELRDLNRKIINNRQTLEDAQIMGASEEKINEIKKEGLLLDNDRLDKINEATAATVAFREETEKDALKSATAFAEARVILAKEGSRQELEAQIEAIRTKQKEELSNVNLTQGERIKINAAADKQIQDLKKAFQQRDLDDTIKALEAKANLERDGSRRRLDMELTVLELQQEQELLSRDLTEKGKQEILDRYLKLTSDKIREFAKQDSEAEINARVAANAAQISKLQVQAGSATNDKLLQLKKQQVDNEAQLEIISINETERNEETRRLKVKAVYAKALADKQQLEKDKNQASINAGLTEAQSVYDSEIARQDRIMRSEQASAKQKRQAQEESFKYQQGKIESEALANEQSYETGLVTYDQYLQKHRELKDASDELEFQKEQAHLARMLQVREFAQQTALQLVNALSTMSKKSYASEEASVKKLYDEKRITEEEYNNRMKAIKTKQAEDEKAMAIFSTLVQQGPAVLKGFKEGGFAGAAAAFALFFSLLSAVQGAEIPAFKDGVIDLKGPGTSTSDSIPARLSKGETVTTARQTKKHKDALTAIHNDKFHDYMVKELPNYFSNASVASVPEVQTVMAEPVQIDYEKMAQALAGELSAFPHTSINVDENGFYVAQKKANDTIEYKNKKLNL